MFYTDMKILIHSHNDVDELKNAIDQLEDWLIENYGIKAEFEYAEDEEKKFPMYLIPDGVTWQHLDDVLRPDIGLRAINDDNIVLEGVKTIDVKHHLTDEELIKYGEDLSNTIREKHEIEGEKAVSNKNFKIRLDKQDAIIDDYSDIISQGYRIDEKECIIKVDFKEKKKYYLDKNDVNTIHDIRDLEPEDFQLKLNHTFEAKVIALNQDEENQDEAVDIDDLPFGEDEKESDQKEESENESSDDGTAPDDELAV